MVEHITVGVGPLSIADVVAVARRGAAVRLSPEALAAIDTARKVVDSLAASATPVYGVSSDMDGHVVRETGPGEYRAVVEFPALPLLPGSYAIRVHSMDPEGVRLFDTVERGLVVRGASREFGLVRLAHRWIGDAAAMPAADADA